MNHLDADQDTYGVVDSPRSSVMVPCSLGWAFNLLTIAIGEPYLMAIVGLVVALAATLAWSSRPLAWVMFVVVIAANPANPTTPIALNLLCAAVFLVLKKRGGLQGLPRLTQVALFFVLLSMVVSVLASLSAELTIPSIHTADISRPRPWMATWTGGATIEAVVANVVSVVNFLLGPFLFIPLIFSRIRHDHEPALLLKGLVFGLIMPTLLMFMLARVFGQPILDATSLSENLLNVLGFHLGRVDIQMIRTQVGIILAALICASFAVSISRVERGLRMLATGCLLVAAYLLLVTGSVGSTLAGLAGILLILFLGRRQFSIKRYLVLVIVGVGLVVTTWAVLPQGLQRYAMSRYELRISDKGSATDDRASRWKKSFDYLLENPSGVGWSIYIEPIRTYPHNDYLTYAIAFGLICGLVYLLFPAGMLFSFLSFNPRSLDPSRFALTLVGAGVTTVMLINSMSDHMTANRWYFNVVWSLIWYAFFASRAGLGPSGAKIP